MKVSHILPLAAVTSAFVLPSEHIRELDIENYRRSPCLERILSEKDRIVENSKELFNEWSDEAVETSRNVWGNVRESFEETLESASDEADALTDKFSEVASWVYSEADDIYEEFDDIPSVDARPHHKPNLTVYQLIAGSKYTTKLAKLINEFDDLVDALNSTKANYTVFAPTDKALDKIPEHAPKPSKEQLKKFLSYHVVPELYPAGRVLFADTAPTLLKSDSLSSKPEPQRLAFRLRWKGLTVNFYSRIISPNIFGTNGVIHGVDTPIFPPIGAIREIDLFPSAFSTLELGLAKTGLLDQLNSTDHPGGTLFAPNNAAFEKLGPKANAFLFSKYGLKYLKALLQYHVVPENTLYSDAYYKAESSEFQQDDTSKGKIHVDLPTFLKDRSLAVDIARWGPILVVKINGFNTVAVQNVVAEDGVIHVMTKVIIPPKQGADSEEYEDWDGGEVSVEDLMERLDPYVVDDPKWDL